VKIGPFTLARTTPDTTPAPVKEQGASGTLNLSGFLQDDEYNSDLVGKTGLAVFRRMVDSDGSVREAWLHIRAPLQNARIEVDPASDDPLHLEQAELVRRALFDFPAQSLRQVMPTLLKYLTQGFQIFELPEKIVECQLSWTDPSTDEPVTVASRQFIVWEHFAHRKADTLYKWNAKGGELIDVHQLAFKDGDYGEWTIPADQILLLVNDREGDDFTGQSILRAAYKAWYLKELVEKVNAIAVERHGVGINVMYVPNSARNDTALIDRLEQMLQDLAAGERPYLIIPGPKGSASGTDAEGGFWFEVVTPGSASSDNVPFMTYLRGEIKGSMLVRFSELGHGQTGARATGDVQAKVWYDALHGVAFHIADTFRPVIRRLLEKNYTDVNDLPTLVFRDIDARSMAEFADAVAKLSLANLILPDRSARSVARETVGMPDEDEDALAQATEIDQISQPVTEPLGGGGGNGNGGANDGGAAAAAKAAQIAKRIDELATTVTDARRKNDRADSASALRELGELLRHLPQPAITVETSAREYHAHQHEHEHLEQIDEDRIRQIFAETNRVAASQSIERDDKGRAVRVTEYDADGDTIRTRKIAHDDDGNITTIEEE
jgi:hypothetical protein